MIRMTTKEWINAASDDELARFIEWYACEAKDYYAMRDVTDSLNRILPEDAIERLKHRQRVAVIYNKDNYCKKFVNCFDTCPFRKFTDGFHCNIESEANWDEVENVLRELGEWGDGINPIRIL